MSLNKALTAALKSIATTGIVPTILRPGLTSVAGQCTTGRSIFSATLHPVRF